ncbi:diacylglycerol kinase [Nitrosophilus alvini]|uniref:diacylglycerol kinase n=1 Tax=Nitrosophilus alvini TaxID=2714855 RepID=UPI00190ABB0B|nr:diacylglycerol kinase [Nitrosophilus alvini]
MLFKPGYSLFSNAKYAIDGLKEVFLNETSFKIEVFLFVIMSVGLWFLPVGFTSKALLQVSLFFPLLVEILNSAIERVVDLASPEKNTLAKFAKDAGAAAVLISLVMTSLVWIFTLLVEFGIV